MIEERDVAAVTEALRSDWLTTGPRVLEFEQTFAARVGAAFAVAVSSGTAALHAACVAAGIGPGDEVVVTPMSFVASASCALHCGARVVFADVEPGTLLLSPAQVERSLSPRTRAVITVDYAGQPSHLEELRALTRARGLVLIQDAAHSLGAAYRGRPVGGLADFTTFSFHPVKHIATGEGGMVTTDDPQRAEALRRYRNHGIDADFRQRAEEATWEYEVRELGLNYRLTDLQSALGLAQLERLDAWVARRRALAERYDAALAGLPAVEGLTRAPGRTSSWHLYPIRLRLERLKVDRRQVFRALRAENIGVNVHYIPIPCHPLYRERGHAPEDCPVALAEYERLISLPLHVGMSDADQDDVLTALERVVRAYGR